MDCTQQLWLAATLTEGRLVFHRPPTPGPDQPGTFRQQLAIADLAAANPWGFDRPDAWHAAQADNSPSRTEATMKRNNGYIKLWRQIQETPIWQHSVAVHVFLDLLLQSATNQPRPSLMLGPIVVCGSIYFRANTRSSKASWLTNWGATKTIKAALDLRLT